MSAPLLSRIGGTRAGVWLIGNVISPFQRWVIRTTSNPGFGLAADGSIIVRAEAP